LNRITLLLLLAAALMGCAKEPQPPLRIGTNIWPGYEPLYLARELNYFERADAKLVEFTSTSEVMRAFQNGTIDAAGLTLDEALQLLSIGADIKIVLVMDVSHGADVILAQPGIKSVKELKNGRVGYEATAVGAYMLSRALQLASLKPADIHTVSVELDGHESAFISRKVDAIVTFDPVKAKLLAAGAVKVFDSSQIPGEIVDVLVVRGIAAKNGPEQLRKILKSWFRALEYLNNNKVQAAQIMAVREGVSSEGFLESLHGLRFPDQNENNRMLAGDTPSLLAAAQSLAATMATTGLIHQIPVARTALDGSYLRGGDPQ